MKQLLSHKIKQFHLNKLLAFNKLKFAPKLAPKWAHEDKFQIIFRQQKFLKKLKQKIIQEDADSKERLFKKWKESFLVNKIGRIET